MAAFTFRTGQSVSGLVDKATTANATTVRIQRDLVKQRHIVNTLLLSPRSVRPAGTRHAVSALAGEIADCLQGVISDCAKPPRALESGINRTLKALVLDTERAVGLVDADNQHLATASAHLDEAADALHDWISQWQEWQFQQLLAQLTNTARDTALSSLVITGAAMLLSMISGLAFAVVRADVRRLDRLTGAMLRLGDGDANIEIPEWRTRDEIGKMARALAVFRTTSRRLATREIEMRQVNNRLEAALNSMSQGLCMYDAQSRLVVCNQRAREMLGFSSDAQLEGRFFEEVMDLVASLGAVPIDNLDAIKRRIQHDVASKNYVTFTTTLRDGRVWSVWLAPLRDGGWTSTIEDITERRANEAKIEYMAHHDALTGLANRVLFQTELEAAMADAQRGLGCAVHCIDLDRFKEINDTLGHQVGDAVLREVAARLRKAGRETNLVARLGGDEFAVIQFDAGRQEDAGTFAERLIALFAAPLDIRGNRIRVGISIGTALAPADGAKPDELLPKADLALYQAKADGRGTHRFYDASMGQQLQKKIEMEHELCNALSNGEFELHYQAQVNLATRKTTGFEALLRWRSPRWGLVPPAEFIPLAEENHLMIPIGEWVIRQACADAATWPKCMKIAVNVSAVQFKSDNLLPVIRLALKESGIAPDRLEIEITESTLLQQSEQNLQMLHELRALGVRVSMDDFGTGYSSLSYLQRFPFDKIKIDQSFVAGLGGEEGSDAIIRAITGLGSSLGIDIIAEGIETEAQLTKIRGEGCDSGQGYLFSRPRPAADLGDLLRHALESCDCAHAQDGIVHPAD